MVKGEKVKFPSGKKPLIPRPRDLTYCNWATNKVVRHVIMETLTMTTAVTARRPAGAPPPTGRLSPPGPVWFSGTGWRASPWRWDIYIPLDQKSQKSTQKRTQKSYRGKKKYSKN